MVIKNESTTEKSKRKLKRDLFNIATFGVVVVLAVLTFMHVTKESDPFKKARVEYLSRANVTYQAYVTSEALFVKKGDKTTEHKLPSDMFFVAVAPYYEITHDCTTHYLTTCKGELFNESFKVLVKDKEGQIVIDKEIKSTKRGWINLWLPKNGTFEATVTHAGISKTKTITTNPGDKTCVSDFYMK